MKQVTKPSLAVVHPHISLIGEGPVWDAEKQVICWLDILNGEIHEYNPVTSAFKTISVGQMVGSFAICADGGMISGLEKGVAFIDRETGEPDIFASPEIHIAGNRFNEGKCDPQGRFWVGTMSHVYEPEMGNLYTVEKDNQLSKKVEKVGISNGLAWSPDHQTMYYIDTLTYEVAAFDYDAETGDISNRRTALKFPESGGYPDGMTIDSEGMLWIAFWDGWHVRRYNPQTGEKLLEIAVPAARASSCTFGGENFEDLYITTARAGLTPEQLEEQPLAGTTFVWKSCGYRGLPADVCGSRKVDS
jgi:sugar lactone lactonase YvrE